MRGEVLTDDDGTQEAEGRPNRTAPWVLRLGRVRVYYDVRDRSEKVVLVRAIGFKDRNRLTIGGEEIDLS